MTLPIVSLNTARTPASQRPEYWAGALATLCGPVHAEALGGATLDGRIDYASIQRLRLCHIEASGHRIMHAAAPAGGGDAVVKVVFQTCGTSVFEQDAHRFIIRPGDCFVYDVSQPHVITSLAPTKHNVIIMPRSLMAQRGAPAGPLHARQASAREGAGRLAHDFLMSAFTQAPALSPGLETQVAETLLDLAVLPFFAAATAPDAAGRDGLRQRIKALVQEHLGDPELSIERISASLGCTKRYLHMSFADEGMTITRYIWQQRLEKCLAELELGPRPGRSLTDIAFSWGFNSSSHFAHLFKKHYGIAPSAVQRQAGREGLRMLSLAAEP
ncbi:transcriptional regulator [Azorhizobium oxalatiphilum]|uniref:Transcriptional regulator n=1 Tax=Azorhizobium oxalatiphilum TaxID=980631 RepID=A0A917CAX3_9HYPH|nr:helix-turn-helix domain-containing protein [Azorhizobium oxalatiphilum]GGF78847.1 transcriptional regulator [Azorhizobium oxalatiphilum]